MFFPYFRYIILSSKNIFLSSKKSRLKFYIRKGNNADGASCFPSFQTTWTIVPKRSQNHSKVPSTGEKQNFATFITRVNVTFRMTNEEYSAPESKKEILKSGTYLHCYCPHCNQGLNKDGHLVFIVEGQDGEKGILKLSPYLNVFARESTIYVKEGGQAKDLICPHCDTSLVVEDKTCEEVKDCEHGENCSVPAARILIAALTKIIPFYICMRVNCHWHGLSDEDEKLIHLDESKEW